MVCRYCGENKKLIKAHVIPEAFFRRLRDEQISPILLTNRQNEYPKKMPIGVYDSQILCEECEPRFGSWDNYAQYFLGRELRNSVPIIENGQITGYEIEAYKYELLKLFFVSLLWRASISLHSFYAKVKLGSYQPRAKQLIEQGNPGSEDEFSVTLAKFDHKIGETIFDPHPEKWKRVNYYRFYLGSYVAYIKVDKRKAPEPLSNFVMSPGKPLLIIRRDFERSKELPLLKKIVTAANIHVHRTK